MKFSKKKETLNKLIIESNKIFQYGSFFLSINSVEEGTFK